MAYKKYKGKGKAHRKAIQSWYNTAYTMTPKQLASQALKGVWYLKGLVNSEMKHVITASASTPSNSGSIIHLTAVGQGDSDVANRSGNSIFVRNLFARLSFERNASATNTFVRYIFFIDTQQVGDTNPTVATVLNSSSTLSALNTGTAGRFKILKDGMVSLSSSGQSAIYKKIYLNMRHHVRYNADSGSDQQKGAIYLLVISDQATNTPTFTYNIKIGYHDN